MKRGGVIDMSVAVSGVLGVGKPAGSDLFKIFVKA